MKKTVLITGATSGIGYEFSKIFMENNYDVILVGRNLEKLMELDKYELAKKYIVYRYTRALVRKSNTTDESILGLIRNENKEIAEENSNKNTMGINMNNNFENNPNVTNNAPEVNQNMNNNDSFFIPASEQTPKFEPREV